MIFVFAVQEYDSFMQHMHSSLKVETDHKKRTGQFLMDVCMYKR